MSDRLFDRIEQQRKKLVALGIIPPTSREWSLPITPAAPSKSLLFGRDDRIHSPGGTDILAQFSAIKSAVARTEFYRKNKVAYDAAWDAAHPES
jgi:hypothetical protein